MALVPFEEVQGGIAQIVRDALRQEITQFKPSDDAEATMLKLLREELVCLSNKLRNEFGQDLDKCMEKWLTTGRNGNADVAVMLNGSPAGGGHGLIGAPPMSEASCGSQPPPAAPPARMSVRPKEKPAGDLLIADNNSLLMAETKSNTSRETSPKAVKASNIRQSTSIRGLLFDGFDANSKGVVPTSPAPIVEGDGDEEDFMEDDEANIGIPGTTGQSFITDPAIPKQGGSWAPSAKGLVESEVYDSEETESSVEHLTMREHFEAFVNQVLALFGDRAAENREKIAKKMANKSEDNSHFHRARIRMLHIVESPPFDFFISSWIVLNSITIGLQTNYSVMNLEHETPFEYQVLERVFFFIFAIELTLRIFVYGAHFITMPDWRWNIFDSAIVGLQCAEEVSSLIMGGGESSSNFSFMRVMRILRLVRIMRLVRLLRFVQELRTMVCSIASSFKSLCWTLVLIFGMQYVLGVYLTQLIADSGHENPDIMKSGDLKKYYGNLMRSILSLYQAMTGGVDWDDLLNPLEVHVSPWLQCVFVMYIAFAVLAMMNVVTGVFVESALQTAKEDRERDVMTHVRRLFNLTDKDCSGTITWDEFVKQLDKPDMDKYFKSLDIEASEARGLFLLLDTDESGTIDSEEFMQGCLRLRGPAKAIDLATLMYFNKRLINWFRERFQSFDDSLDLIEETLAYTGGVGTASGSGPAIEAKRSSLQERFASGRRKSADDEVGLFATWAELKNEGNSRMSEAEHAEEDVLGGRRGSQKKFHPSAAVESIQEDVLAALATGQIHPSKAWVKN